MSPRTVEILLPNALDHGFDYHVPEGMPLAMGDIVRVPIGKSETLGVVWGEGKTALAPEKYKSIIARCEQFPPLSPAFRKFITWVAWYNAAPLGAVLKMVLPVAEADTTGRKKHDHLANVITASALKLMPLSQAQRQGADALKAKLSQGFSVSVLDGVTGSGKTEVYFDVIANLLNAGPSAREAAPHVSDVSGDSGGNQILILLPEIALSVQWLERFEARFGIKPLVWNSTLTPARRKACFQAIAAGTARVIVGARSALFLPYPRLSLVVVDEEHDSSFKQEDGVMYHARDMAVARAAHEKFPIILASATPSLETVHNMQQGKYDALHLPHRHADAQMPTIHMLDMRTQKLERDSFISRPLREAIAAAVSMGHQAMLFLNRRGYAPLMLCRKCGHRFQCPDCSAWMVLHKARARSAGRASPEPRPMEFSEENSGDTLKCHHCSYTIPLPKQCPECHADESLHACGPGVERVHEEIAAALPQARIATLASDSTNSYTELSDIIGAMERKEIDILIGTQMIAKGHHFADLAVVGIVDADLGLAGGDLRAGEKTYQLLHQISGRAGRETIAGHVYVQSYMPEHPVMAALMSGEREAFFTAELAARENAHMPPFSRLAALIVEGKNEAQVNTICKQLSLTTQHSALITIYGPAPAPLFILRGKYRYRFLVKADRNINLSDFIKQWLAQVKIPSSIRVKIDIDPMNFV